MFWQFSAVSFVGVSEGCVMVSVTLFKVCCKSHVRFCCCVGCYDCLVDYVHFKAFSFKWALVFPSAVTMLVRFTCRLLCWGWGVYICIYLYNQIVSWNPHRLLECSIVRLEHVNKPVEEHFQRFKMVQQLRKQGETLIHMFRHMWVLPLNHQETSI